jgi:hypothetical protein
MRLKHLFGGCVALTIQLQAAWDLTGSTALENESFLNKGMGKHDQSLTVKQSIELDYAKGDFKFFTKLYAQGDLDDTKRSTDKTKRSFARVDEFYLSREFYDGASKLLLGKKIRHWGALEAKNITDVFNPLDMRNSSDAKDKLGVWNTQFSYYTDNGELSLIVKHYEQDQKISAQPYGYYFLPATMRFDERLVLEEKRNYPTTYISYTASTEWDNALDYALIFQHGYDSQKLYTLKSTTPLILQANSYLVNKFLTYNTMVVGATLLKAELVYADVLHNSAVSDYVHAALGFEHEIERFLQSDGKLGLIAEYYHYETLEANKKTDLDLYEVFQNDLFIGMRFTFNDVDNSSFLMGAVIDTEYDESAFSAEYQTRLKGGFKIETKYQYIEPSQSTQTAYASLGRVQSLRVDLSYHF